MCPAPASSLGSVLVVDDDELFRDAAAMTLKDAGYEVVTAANARAGSTIVKERRFDAVVADIQMAGNTRLEWLHELARSAPGVPVVVVTGHPSMRTAIHAVRLPVVAYLIKPVSADELVKEVAQARTQRVPAAPVEAAPGIPLPARLERHRALWELTPRQAEVLERVVQGDSNKEIAAQLGCALRTVELHVSAVLERSGQASRSALIARFWSDR